MGIIKSNNSAYIFFADQIVVIILLQYKNINFNNIKSILYYGSHIMKNYIYNKSKIKKTIWKQLKKDH